MERLTALTAFRRTAEKGSFAEASRGLGMTPAAIGKNVAELEARLGVRLFNRTTRRMSLTEAGLMYLSRIVPLLDGLDEADQAMGPLNSKPIGTLRVAAPMTTTLVCLSRAIPKFLEQFPDIKLDLDLNDRRVDIVRDGFDLAIRGSDALEDSSLTARKLMTLPHVVCASPRYLEAAGTPVTPEDLKGHNCIRFSLSGHADVWEFYNGDERVSVPVQGRYSVTTSLAVRDALLEGFGLSLIPLRYVAEDLATGRLVSLLPDWTKVELSVYAIYPSRHQLSPKLRVFLDFVVAELRQF